MELRQKRVNGASLTLMDVDYPNIGVNLACRFTPNGSFASSFLERHFHHAIHLKHRLEFPRPLVYYGLGPLPDTEKNPANAPAYSI